MGRKTSIQYFPSFSFQEETGLQFGLHLVTYFDISKSDTVSRRSKVENRIYYTTLSQYYTYNIWQLFTKDEGYNVSGQFQAGYWIDRLYPVGGRSDLPIIEFHGTKKDTLNYANYSYHFANFYSVFDKKIAPHHFAGLMVEYDQAAKNKFLADSVNDFNAIQLARNNATRVGLGLNYNYDSRDNYDNPLKGTYIQVVGGLYRKAFGSSVDYHILTMDADAYINTYKDQTLALRLVTEYRQPDGSDPIPIRGLAYNGGISYVRGYYSGTYRANNLAAIETEYRLPINIKANAPFWKFWERFGMVFFLSTVKASDNFTDLLSPTAYHFAGGLGIRYALNIKQRLNVTFDYAIGFDKSADLGKRPTGLYFNLGEAF